MAEVTLEIGGRRYDVTCRDGEEDHLRHLAALVDGKAAEARAAVGGVNEARHLLFASLLLADELDEVRTKSNGSAPAPANAGPLATPREGDAALASALERLAGRVEAVAEALEGSPAAH